MYSAEKLGDELVRTDDEIYRLFTPTAKDRANWTPKEALEKRHMAQKSILARLHRAEIKAE